MDILENLARLSLFPIVITFWILKYQEKNILR